MINAKAIKKFIDDALVKELERITQIMTIADLGPKAKQTDVSKCKAAIRERISKLTTIPRKVALGPPEEVKESQT